MPEDNKHWYELRLRGKLPERRGYNSCFVHESTLYIYGGHDIREGSMDTLWKLPLDTLRDLSLPEAQQEKNCGWTQVSYAGKEQPGPLAHHSSVEYNGKMFLFGGSNLEYDNKLLFSLDLKSYEWRVVKTTGDQGPKTRDEHSAVVHEKRMVVYGGFVEGAIQNDMWALNLDNFAWEEMQQGEKLPPARAGHSTVLCEGAMWVFGGKDEENNKLNDLWKFDFASSTWEEVKCKGDAPLVLLFGLTVLATKRPFCESLRERSRFVHRCVWWHF